MKSIEYKNYTIEINFDTDLDSPRNWDNLGEIIHTHKRINLGSKKASSMEEIKELIEDKNILAFPLYCYEHGNIMLSLSDFNERFDSGQVGFYYVSRDKIKKEYNCKIITKSIKEKVYKCFQSEINTYNQYLNGEVYCFCTYDQDENSIDSCCGFYDYDDCLNEAKSMIDYHIKEKVLKRKEKLKTLIKNNVPIEKREMLLQGI